MPPLAVQLFHGTAHLGSARVPVFAEFLTKVRAIQGGLAIEGDEEDYYSYPALALALSDAEYNTSR